MPNVMKHINNNNMQNIEEWKQKRKTKNMIFIIKKFETVLQKDNMQFYVT